MKIICYTIMAVLMLQFKNASAQTMNSTKKDEAFENELKILSWNIYMLPPLVYITGKRKRAKVMGDYFAQSDYDILVLQETFHPGARRKIKRRSKDEFPYRIGPVNRRIVSLRTNSGISMYSRIPFEKLAQCKFKEKATRDDKLARKGALMVQLEKNNQAFQIVGTHLNAGGPIAVRHAQAEQIRDELLEPYYQDGIPQIIAGDMNMRKSENHEFMLKTYKAENGKVATDPYTKMEDCKYYDVYFEDDPIDYIFFRSNEIERYDLFRYSPCIAGAWKMDCKRCYRGELQNGYEKDPDGIHYWLSDHPPVSIEIKW